jgi:hypothetical protein
MRKSSIASIFVSILVLMALATTGCPAVTVTTSPTPTVSAAPVTPSPTPANFVIPDGTTIIAAGAYMGWGFTSVTIPASVTSIGSAAFYGCPNLTTVIFSGTSSLTKIENQAFEGCINLTGITIPASVTYISTTAFSQCPKLTGITVNPANTNYASDSSGVLFTKDGSQLLEAPGAITAYSIPTSVTAIFSHAFSYTNLTSVTIPSSVTSIGSQAFAYCAYLTDITVSAANANYKSDSTGVLFNKSGATLIQAPGGIKSYTIPDGVTSIGDSAFGNSTALTSITIPGNVLSIGQYAFDGCPYLDNVTISTGLTSIGLCAFQNCASLMNLTFPSSVTSVGGCAFQGCYVMGSITFNSTTPPTLSSESYAFNCGSIQIKVPSGTDPVSGKTYVALYQASTGWSDYASEIVSQ